MKKLLIILNLSILALLPTHSFAALKLSDNIEVYRGEGNLRVAVVRLLPLEDNQALVRISGIDHELNGLVIQHSVDTRDSNRRFMTKMHGRDFSTLVETTSWSYKSITLYLYGERKGLSLAFDQEGSKAINADELSNAHIRQASEGLLAKVQNFDRDMEIQVANERVSNIESKIAEACNTDIDLKIDWSSVSDDMIKELSVVGYCSSAMNRVNEICSDDSGKAWVKKSISSVSCEFSDKLKLDLVGKKLRFKTTPDAANQSDFVKYNLMNLR